jgi:hypothetical protein
MLCFGNPQTRKAGANRDDSTSHYPTSPQSAARRCLRGILCRYCRVSVLAAGAAKALLHSIEADFTDVSGDRHGRTSTRLARSANAWSAVNGPTW